MSNVVSLVVPAEEEERPFRQLTDEEVLAVAASQADNIIGFANNLSDAKDAALCGVRLSMALREWVRRDMQSRGLIKDTAE